MQTIDEIRKELEELEEKKKKIHKMILSGEIEQLREKEKEYIYKQKGFMEAYANILQERIDFYICVETAKEITEELIREANKNKNMGVKYEKNNK